MCWACYTPLSGLAAGLAGAPAAVGTLPKGMGSRAIGSSVDGDEGKKKGVDPKIIGVGAFLVVGGLVAFFLSSALGGSSSIEELPSDPALTRRNNEGGGFAPPAPPQGAPPPAFAGGGGGGGGGAPPPNFTTVAPPNPEFATCTMGIRVDANLSALQAASFARLARNQVLPGSKWTKVQVSVFTDKAAADAFATYQNKRRGAPLTEADFSQLATSGVWNSAPAFLESQGKRDKNYAPSQNPSSWWRAQIRPN